MPVANAPFSRRQFCAGACQAASCAALSTIFAGCGSGGSPTSPTKSANPLPVLSGRFTGSAVAVDVAGTAIATVGGAALIDNNAGVFLIARTSDTSFTAIDGVCTHESCTVTGSDGTDYVCPCHGSRYDRNGRVVNGPAKASLRQYPTTFAGGVVTIAL
jgi:Rieske Fe-S protein